MNYKNPLKLINPANVAAIANTDMTLQPSIPVNTDMTLQPPIPANQQGTARPLFNETAQNTAGQIYGDINARQMSLGNNAPMFMSDKQEEAFGPGSEVYKSGNTAIYEGLEAKSNK